MIRKTLLPILIFIGLINPAYSLGFYCKHTLSLTLKGYSFHKEYESSLKMIESKLFYIRMMTTRMLKEKVHNPKDKVKVLNNFQVLNSHFKEHQEIIEKVSETTSCAGELIQKIKGLQKTLKKPLQLSGIRELNTVSTEAIKTLTEIKQ